MCSHNDKKGNKIELKDPKIIQRHMFKWCGVGEKPHKNCAGLNNNLISSMPFIGHFEGLVNSEEFLNNLFNKVQFYTMELLTESQKGLIYNFELLLSLLAYAAVNVNRNESNG